ncbi:MAG TPA: aldehyde dehydrogenase family protein [Solirubrobacteraceae bacterium]|jgi:succinate-semialdehyde dehydrogenase/glutarate-semialdehyde dehydrogenase|nr:aldehyde dehydrogenase family protein [Solirubrobacteraceae bacterium]
MPVPATAAAPVQSVSPIDGAQLATLQATAPAAVPAAVAEAAEVQRLWAQLRLRDRARYLARAAQAVIDEWDELAEVIVAEQGRPLAEAQSMELLPAVETLQWLAEAGPRVLAAERIGLSRSLQPVKRARLTFEPLGVVAVLTPGAEPFATPLGDVAVALMGGNGVVLHPSPLAALAAERIGRVFVRAGLPEGLLQIVHGPTGTARALVSAPEVAHVRFTGSSVAGRDVGEACARELKRATIEVGGKDPMLVLADANIPRAIAGALWGAFANAGQSGGSLARAYVLRERAERFTAGVVAGARALRVGHPSDPRTEIGPLLAGDRVARLVELLDEAVDGGATLHCGGPVSVGSLSGAFFAPAVLTGVAPDARLLGEDAPGPWIAIEVVDSEQDGIACCNAGVGGLGASVWTADSHKGARVAREIRAGMVWMNDHVVSRAEPQLPWGAVHGAGIGRARGAVALRASVEPKLVTWDPTAGRMPWWQPYDASLVNAWRALARLRSVRDADRERGWRSGARPLARVALRSVRAVRRR